MSVLHFQDTLKRDLSEIPTPTGHFFLPFQPWGPQFAQRQQLVFNRLSRICDYKTFSFCNLLYFIHSPLIQEDRGGGHQYSKLKQIQPLLPSVPPLKIAWRAVSSPHLPWQSSFLSKQSQLTLPPSTAQAPGPYQRPPAHIIVSKSDGKFEPVPYAQNCLLRISSFHGLAQIEARRKKWWIGWLSQIPWDGNLRRRKSLELTLKTHIRVN